MDWLLELDRDAFLTVNGCHSEWADAVMVTLSGRWLWVVLGAGLVAWLFIKQGLKQTLILLFCIGLGVLLADQISATLFKPMVGRLRPCHDPNLEGLVHLYLGKCGGQFGFVSSHAANFFCVVTILSMRAFAGRMFVGLLLFMIAFIVSYSRIYLGVHYPGDILFGGLLGVLLGVVIARWGHPAVSKLVDTLTSKFSKHPTN